MLITAYAKALEIIPRQLCDNAGFDAITILNKLRQKHAQGKYLLDTWNVFSLIFIAFFPPFLVAEFNGRN